MFIEEIPKDSRLLIVVKINNETMEFESSAIESGPKRHTLIAKTVLKDGKVIGFNAKGIFIEMHYFPEESPPLVFKNVKIELFKDKQNEYAYCIGSLAEGILMNRRESYRIFIGRPVVVQCGANQVAYDAILKDLCGGGFSITVDKNLVVFKEKQIVHTVLNDRIEETCTNYSFQLFGLIVRITELPNGKMVYGCKLNSKVPGLETYVSVKDRLRIQGKRNSSQNKKQ